jgi:nitrogenase delta subunit
MSEKIDALYGYVQERCLWQFASRVWDRKANIEGTIALGTALLLGETPTVTTPAERCYLVDAKVMVSDFRSRFPWLRDCSPEEIKALMAELQAKLTDIAITKSQNHELTHELY